MSEASAGRWSIALERGLELTERPVWDERECALVGVDILQATCTGCAG